MKLIIFAGGHGTRLWPLSRKNSPKQFEEMFDDRSTLQLAVDRVKHEFGMNNIYISTNNKFKDIVTSQLPDLPDSNLFLEPVKRDVAAASGLSFMRLKAMGYSGPVAILWADHLMQHVEEFVKALKLGKSLIKENSERIIFFGEKPRFANQNLGWITIGDIIQKKDNINIFKFKSWKYRPTLEKCKAMFDSNNYLWNPGYFVTSVDFMLSLYDTHMNVMFKKLKKIITDPTQIDNIYPTLESISFDNAIIEKISPNQAIVLGVNLGWSDPGTLYALKESLAKNTSANITKGNTYELDTKDSLIINQEDSKILTTIGIDGFIVINTKDAIIIVHKDNVPKVKKLVEKLEGTGLGRYV